MAILARFGEYYDVIYRGIIDYRKGCEVLEKILEKFTDRTVKDVLDAGRGTGSRALILSEHGYKVVGIDISETMIKRAKRKAEKENHKRDLTKQVLGMIEKLVCSRWSA